MTGPVGPAPIARFGEFELDLRSGELRRAGVRVALAEQPRSLLEVLLEQPGTVVSREQLRERLWPADTFVDFEHGLNAAIKRRRDALGDSAEHPRFIETVPKRGYRFIAPVHIPAAPAPAPATGDSSPRTPKHRAILATGLGAAALALAATIVAARSFVRSPHPDEGKALRPSDGGALGASPKLTRLTFDAGIQADPTFSPDGRSIAYTSNKSGNFDIWMQPIGGGTAVQLTADPADDTQPDWSPDGRSIVFRSELDGGGLYVLSTVDRHVRRVTHAGYYPQWSPDGTRFLFNSSLFASARFYTAAADGTEVAPIVGAPSAISTGATAAARWHGVGPVMDCSSWEAAIVT